MSAAPVFRRNLLRLGLLAFAALLALLPATAGAQPFGSWLLLNGPTSGYVEVPNSADLNPAGAITLEAWVNLTQAGSTACNSIIGKGWTTSWWVGICGGTTLRSYLKGSSSLLEGGVINPHEWNHIAVVYDGVHRFHYVNGELVKTSNETGALPANASAVRIGSDTSYAYTPLGGIDEVRIWNVARTQAQIRAGMSGLSGSQPGLVALWPLNDNTNDPVGGHTGTLHGLAGYGTFSTGASCSVFASSTRLCLLDRFLVTAKYRVGPQANLEGTANVVPVANPGSGLFWFFGPDNWEVMVKALNACGLTSTYWIFSAATTNVFYRMDVRDYRTGTQKIYFNYSGPPAPAVTDVNAFATCP
jgi:hypothetical protein